MLPSTSDQKEYSRPARLSLALSSWAGSGFLEKEKF